MGKALSVYDVGLGDAVCKHRTLQEQIQNPCSTTMHGSAATTLKVEDAYLDLLRRGLTNFCTRTGRTWTGGPTSRRKV